MLKLISILLFCSVSEQQRRSGDDYHAGYPAYQQRPYDYYDGRADTPGRGQAARVEANIEIRDNVFPPSVVSPPPAFVDPVAANAAPAAAGEVPAPAVKNEEKNFIESKYLPFLNFKNLILLNNKIN
jgi:hypothetical protein